MADSATGRSASRWVANSGRSSAATQRSICANAQGSEPRCPNRRASVSWRGDEGEVEGGRDRLEAPPNGRVVLRMDEGHRHHERPPVGVEERPRRRHDEGEPKGQGPGSRRAARGRRSRAWRRTSSGSKRSQSGRRSRRAFARVVLPAPNAPLSMTTRGILRQRPFGLFLDEALAHRHRGDLVGPPARGERDGARRPGVPAPRRTGRTGGGIAGRRRSLEAGRRNRGAGRRSPPGSPLPRGAGR